MMKHCSHLDDYNIVQSSGMVQAQLPYTEKVRGSIPTIANKRMNWWLSVHAEIVFSLHSWGTAECWNLGFMSPLCPGRSPKQCPSEKPISRCSKRTPLLIRTPSPSSWPSDAALRRSNTSAAQKLQLCTTAHSPKPQTFWQAGREKQKIWELTIKRRASE